MPYPVAGVRHSPVNDSVTKQWERAMLVVDTGTSTEERHLLHCGNVRTGSPEGKIKKMEKGGPCREARNSLVCLGTTGLTVVAE